MLVVFNDTWPSHARTVLISTPACSKWVAVVWRMVVWTHAFCSQRRQPSRHLGSIALDQAMNSKSSYGSSTAVKKSEVRLRATIDKWKEHANSFGPKWATTEFVPFTSDHNRGESGARCNCKLQISSLGLRSLVLFGSVAEKDVMLSSKTNPGGTLGELSTYFPPRSAL
jgi:hypothetical protein